MKKRQLGCRSVPEKLAGIGLRSQHHQQVLADQPAVGWLEVHSENYFAAGGPARHYLHEARRHYPISLHGVGLSIGSTDPLDKSHLAAIKHLAEQVEPFLISEHLCWGSVNGHHYNDLLPLPYTEEALSHVVQRIGQVQDYLGTRVLLENVSSYLEFTHSTIPEWEFIVTVARQAGCGILLDVNNVYVNSVNHGFDPLEYLLAIPPELVEEIHLAGHTRTDIDGTTLLIDSHSAPVCNAVWKLYAETLRHTGTVPTLIEWDNDIPPLNILVAEADKAHTMLEKTNAVAA